MQDRLLLLCYEYPPLGGGGGKVLAGLCEQLGLDTGLQMDLVTMWYRGLRINETTPSLHIHRVPCLRMDKTLCRAVEMLPYLPLALARAYRLQIRYDYALNHTHFIFPDGLTAYLLKRLTGLPYVITAHGSDVPGYNPDRFTRLHRWLMPLWRRIVANAGVVICPSRTIEGLIRTHLPSARTIVIPNAIDVNRFKANGAKDKKILLVTRMFERKGVQYFLEAVAPMKTDFTIHIVGDGPYLPVLQHFASTRRIPVVFHGFLENHGPVLRDLFETARIFVFTSEAENFPMVLLEAMASGCAIITTDDTGCAEVVGDTALLVPPRDPVAIRHRLQQLIEDPSLCAELGSKARERVCRYFTWEAVARQHQMVYRRFALR